MWIASGSRSPERGHLKCYDQRDSDSNIKSVVANQMSCYERLAVGGERPMKQDQNVMIFIFERIERISPPLL